MANTAFTHDPTITVPSSSTANGVVLWNGTTGKNFDNANHQYLLFDGNSLDVKNNGTASSVKLYCESSNAHAITLKSPAHSTFSGGSWTLTLPGIDGDNGQFLQTNGSGVTSWAAAGSQTPWTANVSAANFTLSNVGNANSDWTAGDLRVDSSGGGIIGVTRINTGINLSDTSTLGSIRFGAQDADSNADNDAVRLTGQAAGAWTSSSHPSALGINLKPSGSTTSAEFYRFTPTDFTVKEGNSYPSVTKGIAKAWCRIQPDGTLTAGDYNVASITDHQNGVRTIVWDVDFADAEYSVVGSINDTSVGLLFPVFDDNNAVGSVGHNIYNPSVALIDEETCVVAFGEQ